MYPWLPPSATYRLLFKAEDTKKRWQEYTEELYQKELDVPDNPDSVVADLEPAILESEVKWALEILANNKAVEVMPFQWNYLKY